MTRKIATVTGTRADYGLLLGTMKEIQDDPALSLRLMVTGAHLEEHFGATWKAIEADGFRIDDRIPLGITKDTPIDIAEAMGRGMGEFVKAFIQSKPDIVLVLGDRYEMFMAAQAAMLCRLPIAHIHGGERTEGAMDEAFRHAITKMAHLHFGLAREKWRANGSLRL
jgi:UDP-hydrolysing UDP-N-acetyl-D-glucosamine 2-epimerase